MLRRKRFWLGLIVSLLFLGIFTARTDLGEIRHAFAGANYWLAFGVVPLYFVGFWIRAMRWRLLLKPVVTVTTLRLYPVVLIGLMGNNVAPARIGELVRAYLLGERENVSKSATLGTIAVDRAFDGLTLVAMLGLAIAVSGADVGVKVIGVVTAVLFAIATALLASLALSVRARQLLATLLTRLPGEIGLRAEALVESFLTGLAAIRNRNTLLLAGGLSLASWLTEALMYYGVGEAFDLNVDFSVYILITAGANLALSVLASPGGVGPFEVTTREVLVFFQVSSASASAYALALHALLLGPVIIVGFVLLWSSQLSLRRILSSPAQQSEAETGPR